MRKVIKVTKNMKFKVTSDSGREMIFGFRDIYARKSLEDPKADHAYVTCPVKRKLDSGEEYDDVEYICIACDNSEHNIEIIKP